MGVQAGAMIQTQRTLLRESGNLHHFSMKMKLKLLAWVRRLPFSYRRRYANKNAKGKRLYSPSVPACSRQRALGAGQYSAHPYRELILPRSVSSS